MAAQRVIKLFAIVSALAGITRNRSKEFFTITVRERFSIAMCFTFVTFVLGLSLSLRSRYKDQFLRKTLPALTEGPYGPVSEKITWDTFEIFLNEEKKLVQDSDWEALSRDPITPGTLTPYLERLNLYNDGLVLQLKEPWDKLKNQSYIGFYLKNQNKLESKKAENGGKLQMLQVHTNGVGQEWVLDEVPTKLGSPFQREDPKSDKPPVATPINWQMGPHYSSLGPPLPTSSNKPIKGELTIGLVNLPQTFKNLFTTPEDKTEKTLLIATCTLQSNVSNVQQGIKKEPQDVGKGRSRGVRWQDIFLPPTEAIAARDVEDTTAGLFHKTRSRLMSGYIYPDLKRDEQLLTFLPVHFLKKNVVHPFMDVKRRGYKKCMAPSLNGGGLRTQKRPLFHNIWEPIAPTSWMILYKLGFAMWVQEIGKDFYNKYGKETILYVLDLFASLGFNPQDIIEELGLDDTFIRVIRKVDRRFADVAGVNHILPELGEIVWFLRSSGRGGQTPKGILLVGPPGTGKTFVVQAIAGEAKVPIIVQSATALTDPNQRQSGPQKLRDLFDEARQLSPCILFIDEIDTLGVSRPHVIGHTMGKDELIESIENPGQDVREIPPQLHYYEQFLESPKNSSDFSYKDDENNDQEENQLTVYEGEDAPGLDPFVIEIIESHNEEHKSKLERLALLMQFLMEIDGLRNLHGVVVIGATNRSSALDQAFTRPGRFEKTLFLQLPDKEKRLEILKLYTKITTVSDATSPFTPKFGVLDYIANRTAGLSAAHLAAAVNQSSIKGIVDKTGHTIETIEHGINRILNRSLRQSQPTLRTLPCNVCNVSNVRNLGDRLDIELQHLTSFPPSPHTLQGNVSNVTPTSLGLQEFTSHLLETLQDKAVSRLLMKDTSLPFHITKSCEVKDTSLLSYTFFEKKCKVKDSKKMSRFAFYQAGKAISQTELPLHPSVSFLPLEPEVFHRSTSDLSKLLLSSEPQRRVVLETRLIGVYAGKAGELLGLSQLTFQSDLGVEELSFAGLIANHMITTWYLYSKKISLQKLILSSISQDEIEIEIEDPILLDLFRHLETKIEDETRLAGRASSRYQQRFAPSWWQKQTMTEALLVEPKDSNWYRLHIPDPKETERNIDWVGPDEHYHSIDANLFKNTETTRNNRRSKTPKPGRPQIRWNDLYLINRDYIYQGLISNCFHKAINLLDKKRELLDLFADQLIRYNLLRQHEIGVIWKQFNIVKASDIPSISPRRQKGWGSYSRRKTPKFIDFDFVKPCFFKKQATVITEDKD